MMEELRTGVHLGDCVELLRDVPSNSANLVIADPPYNIGPRFGIDQEWIHSEGWLPWCEQWLRECHRILDQNGSIFVYGIHHYIGHVQALMYSLGFKYRRMIIWRYENGWSKSTKTLATHYEPILWFSKSDTYYYEPIREPYKSTERLKHPIKKNGKVWTPHPDGRLAGDVWSFPVLAGRRFRDEKVDHPTQKPLSLTNRIVKHFSQLGDLVVVPFGGSGTECLAAHQLGRRFWASEINPQFVQLANERLLSGTDEQALSQLVGAEFGESRPEPIPAPLLY
ncbi:MAG: site-specific DNA-methyltransferase [Cellulomonadaceae bacterium]|jgi:site-specific DNA-methyltransferase (adenine-specific)|nr:site-specific DNA-methyltransferase [Cellulomonadaceae bacterium]